MFRHDRLSWRTTTVALLAENSPDGVRLEGERQPFAPGAGIGRWEAGYVAGLVWTLVVAVAGVASAHGAHRLTAVSATASVSLTYQSGWAPTEHALSRYHVRGYLATLVFLAFDVEMLFMYPWAVVVVEMGATAVVEMFLFLAALLVAVLWALREGALRWT